jgi:hypothetical protein
MLEKGEYLIFPVDKNFACYVQEAGIFCDVIKSGVGKSFCV